VASENFQTAGPYEVRGKWGKASDLRGTAWLNANRGCRNNPKKKGPGAPIGKNQHVGVLKAKNMLGAPKKTNTITAGRRKRHGCKETGRKLHGAAIDDINAKKAIRGGGSQGQVGEVRRMTSGFYKCGLVAGEDPPRTISAKQSDLFRKERQSCQVDNEGGRGAGSGGLFCDFSILPAP